MERTDCKFMFVSSRRRHTRCALVTGVQTCALPISAARAIGLARGGLEDALKYAQERVQFGRPIGEFQAIRFKLAQMATDIEAARQLMYSVCRKIDTGVRCDLEASMVKLFATEMAEQIGRAHV